MVSGVSESASATGTTVNLPMAIAEVDLQALQKAYMALEHPSLAARLSDVVGTPIEIGLKLLPARWYRRLKRLAEVAIHKAFDSGVMLLRHQQGVDGRENYYRGLAAGSGAMGGFFGLPGLVLELPVTTALILRSIAEIARAEGEDPHLPETREACIQVLAFGGTTELDDAAETGYYSVRLALTGYLTSAVSHVTNKSLASTPTPAVMELIQAIARLFGYALSRRAAAQIVPVIGAVGGAAVNTIFMQHFQSVGRAHFTVRRLERKYGQAFVQAQFEQLAQNDQDRRSSR